MSGLGNRLIFLTGSTKKQVELFKKGFAPLIRFLNRFEKKLVFFINRFKFLLFMILSFVKTENKTDSDSNSEDRVETVLRAANPAILPSCEKSHCDRFKRREINRFI
jgi:hypothetical protein